MRRRQVEDEIAQSSSLLDIETRLLRLARKSQRTNGLFTRRERKNVQARVRLLGAALEVDATLESAKRVLIEHVQTADERDIPLSVRICTLAVDRTYWSTFADDLPAHYAEYGRLVRGTERDYQVRVGDPILVDPFIGKSLDAADDDWSRTAHLLLAPRSIRDADVVLSFDLDPFRSRFLAPDALTTAIVQPIADNDDWAAESASWILPPTIVESDAFRARLHGMLIEVAEAGAEVVVLPEGTMTPSLLSWLEAMAESGHYAGSVICVAGSSYDFQKRVRPRKAMYRNTSHIVLLCSDKRQSGGRTVHAATKNRRSFQGLEPIADSMQRPFLKLFSLGHRKLTVVICADFREAPVAGLLRTLHCEVVAVPSLTMGAEPFREFASTAELYARQVGAVVALANTSLPRTPCAIAGAIASPGAAFQFGLAVDGESRRHMVGTGVAQPDGSFVWRDGHAK